MSSVHVLSVQQPAAAGKCLFGTCLEKDPAPLGPDQKFTEPFRFRPPHPTGFRLGIAPLTV